MSICEYKIYLDTKEWLIINNSRVHNMLCTNFEFLFEIFTNNHVCLLPNYIKDKFIFIVPVKGKYDKN